MELYREMELFLVADWSAMADNLAVRVHQFFDEFRSASSEKPSRMPVLNFLIYDYGIKRSGPGVLGLREEIPGERRTAFVLLWQAVAGAL